MDSPAFRLPRAPDQLIRKAAEMAGVQVADFRWLGGKRWYWVTGFLQGQGNHRARLSHAATRAMQHQAALSLPQMEVCEYCQMD